MGKFWCWLKVVAMATCSSLNSSNNNLMKRDSELTSFQGRSFVDTMSSESSSHMMSDWIFVQLPGNETKQGELESLSSVPVNHDYGAPTPSKLNSRRIWKTRRFWIDCKHEFWKQILLRVEK